MNFTCENVHVTSILPDDVLGIIIISLSVPIRKSAS